MERLCNKTGVSVFRQATDNESRGVLAEQKDCLHVRGSQQQAFEAGQVDQADDPVGGLGGDGFGCGHEETDDRGFDYGQGGVVLPVDPDNGRPDKGQAQGLGRACLLRVHLTTINKPERACNTACPFWNNSVPSRFNFDDYKEGEVTRRGVFDKTKWH